MTPDIDDVAVERVIKGDQTIVLNREERDEAIRQMAARGDSTNAIIKLLRVSGGTVARALQGVST